MAARAERDVGPARWLLGRVPCCPLSLRRRSREAPERRESAPTERRFRLGLELAYDLCDLVGLSSAARKLPQIREPLNVTQC